MRPDERGLESLKVNLQHWMEHHGLQTDMTWQEKMIPKSSHVLHLSIPMAGNLARILSPYADDKTDHWHLDRFREFEAIVEDHGFVLEIHNRNELFIVPVGLKLERTPRNNCSTLMP